MRSAIHQPREMGFSKRRSSAPPPLGSSPRVVAATSPGEAPCILCGGPTPPWLTSSSGHAICEGCALETHPVLPEAALCCLCPSPVAPVRGHGDRSICEGCLAFARALVVGDV